MAEEAGRIGNPRGEEPAGKRPAGSLFALGATGFLILLAFLSPLTTDETILDAKFLLRGSREADSSIIVIYLDNQDIENLGGYPVPRVYYATAVHALTELGVSTIGIDVLFEKSSRVYPEYDTLLVDAVRSAGDVVLGCYARGEQVIEERGGMRFHSPPFVHSFPEIESAAAGSGYSNIPQRQPIRRYQRAIPVDSSGAEIRAEASFAEEILRISGRTSRKAGETAPPADRVRGIDFAGGRSAYRMYPFVTFLKSYDSLVQGREYTFPFASFKHAIVLLGVVAEGRSPFLRTVFDQNFPAILYHAAVLDTELRDRSIGTIDGRIVGWICVLAALFFFFYRRGDAAPAGSAAPLIMLPTFILADAALFLLLRVDLPATSPVTFLLLLAMHRTLLAGVRLKGSHAHVVSQVDRLQRKLQETGSEVESLRSRLHMEQEGGERSRELERQIEQYEKELISLRIAIEEEAPAAAADGDAAHEIFEGIIYTRGGPVRKVVEQIRSVAGQDVTVLLHGESGTGKELAARAVHRLSRRADRPFLAVNCGALSETLLESELFGYEKGAFTGAQKTQPGRFERADGGTLFLDEIAETSEAFQVKLLRVLQEGELERVGGDRTIKVDVRIIAATNKDLKKLVAERKFREDLYYRLHVIPISLPALRERRVDIPALVSHFLARQDGGIGCSAAAMEAMRLYEWPGNIREMESIITRAVLTVRAAGRDLIRLADLPEELARLRRKQSDLADLILELLRRKEFARGAINEIAEELGNLDRSTVTEYFRGIVFQALVAEGCDTARAARRIAEHSAPESLARLEKKVQEYLMNLRKEIDPLQPLEHQIRFLRLRSKNLPQKFHPALEFLIRFYHAAR